MPAQENVPIYQLKVTLRHIKPPVWRRIQVRADTTLYKLHYALQIAMGWTNSHLHQFVVDGTYYGQPEPAFDFDVVNERRVHLRDVANSVRDKFNYEYDFGDGWEHAILVEDILRPERRTRYPRCVKGKRNCPPEDVGGPWGYANFLEAILDEKHPEHEGLSGLDWRHVRSGRVRHGGRELLLEGDTLTVNCLNDFSTQTQ